MIDKPDIRVTDDEVAAYQRDGAICLRGLFTDWLEPLARGVEANMAAPGPVATEHKTGVGAGRFFEDYCNWERFPEYLDFVWQSPAAAAAARLMGASRVQFYHEHLLVKEPGTARATPWHHDMPYYGVGGEQVISIWLPIDPVPVAVCPEFVAGSHRWGGLYHPRAFETGENYDYGGDDDYQPVPDIDCERDRHDILAWDMKPGDALFFHFLTLHGAPANMSNGRRRGFSTRWLGDDAHFAERPGTTSPPYPDIGLAPGEPMREDWFPVVWQDRN
ncbi:MAG: phytanoyl-CoA dioxygenase family protein [Alphaproteobacteria bacterium]